MVFYSQKSLIGATCILLLLFAGGCGRRETPPVAAEPEEAISPLSKITVPDLQRKLLADNPAYLQNGSFATNEKGEVVAINLNNCNIRSLNALSGVDFAILDLSSNPVFDLGPLTGCRVKTLLLEHTHVGNLSPLAGMKMERLALQKCSIADFSPLGEISVASLDLRNTDIKDLEVLRGHKELRELRLDKTGVVDLSPLEECSQLHTLTLNGTLIKSLEPLRELPLRIVSLTDSGITDLSPLGDTQIRRLAFTRENIKDGLEEIKEIKSLQAIGKTLSGAEVPREYWKANPIK